MNVRNIDDIINSTPDSHKQAPTIGEAIGALTTRQKIIGAAVVAGTLGAAGAIGFFFGTRRTDMVIEDVIEPEHTTETKAPASPVAESIVPAPDNKVVNINGNTTDQNQP